MGDVEKADNSMLKFRSRLNIIEYLETASSAPALRAYEKNLIDAKAPGLVPVEMIEQWADCIRTRGVGYRVVDLQRYSEPEFSQEEQKAILRFHEIWNEVADKTPDPMPWSIEGLIGTPVWQRLIEGADEALSVFMRRGHMSARAQLSDEAGEG